MLTAAVCPLHKAPMRSVWWALPIPYPMSLSPLKALVAQSCPILCDPLDSSPPGSSVHGLLQARILEWVSISFSRGIFPTQGLNLNLLHCKQMLYCLSHQGRPHFYSRQQWPPTYLLFQTLHTWVTPFWPMRCKQKLNPTVTAEKAFDFLIEEDRQDQNLPSPSLHINKWVIFSCDSHLVTLRQWAWGQKPAFWELFRKCINTTKCPLLDLLCRKPHKRFFSVKPLLFYNI